MALNILIITQNIYPTIDARSFRSTQLAIELAREGHRVTVYSLLGKYNYDDMSKSTGMLIKKLGHSICGCADNDEHSSMHFFNKILRRLFGRLFLYPTIELVPMINKALKHEKDVDLLISIAMPYADHFGVVLSRYRKCSKCWISDCGDPFMGNPIVHPCWYFKYLEKYWCRHTDYIVIPVECAKDAYYDEFRGKINVIPQGFDFANIKLANYRKNEVPTFAYAGSVARGMRDPSNLLSYLCTVKTDFKFYVYTNQKDLFEPFSCQLGSKLIIKDVVQRESLIFQISKMDFIINIENSGTNVQRPSKLIDYSLSTRPILDITSSFDKLEQEVFNEFFDGDYRHKFIMQNLQDFNIINVAHKFIQLYYNKVGK